jgi:integrase
VSLRLPPEEAGPIPVESIVTSEEAEVRLELLEPLDRVVWAIAFYAGLRMGEIRALHRRDVIGFRTLEVRGGWDDREGLQETKTSAGERSVPIMPALRDILAAWQEQSPGGPDDLLFPGLRGGQSFDPSALRRRTYAAWEDAGLSRLKPHHARHTFASWLIAASEPLALVSIYLGHSSSKVTERVYKHLLPDQAERTIERVERYLNAGRDA